ncbi:MAG: hypothetical protein HQ592_11110 [Planctomycetes bacterium]|nr:hypothetical protein [Planctomycetota bacterium]
MGRIIDATQIDQWFVSTRRDAQELLPDLVRRLIIETVRMEQLVAIRIPVGDQINLPGYDGKVETTASHPHVPKGVSVWEMGTGEPQDKANSDYSNRTDNPKGIGPLNSTFVFVTPHSWTGKDDWVNKKKSEGRWGDVRGLDNVDLDNWLEMCPGAARWLAAQMGLRVEDFHDFESFVRKDLEARYGVEISADLIVGGRNEAVSELHEWFKSDSRKVTIEGDSVEEASAFIAAAILSLPEEEAEHVASRVLFVHGPEVLHYLSKLKSEHLVVLLTPGARLEAKALDSPVLRLMLPIGKSAGASPQRKSCISLGSVHRRPCQEALLQMGFSAQRARRLSLECKGSLTAILWMVAEEPDVPLPWTSGEAALDLVPLVLPGQWEADNEADREALQKLANRDYSEIERVIAKWTAPEGPIVRRGAMWDWLAWDFAWTSLTHLMHGVQIHRFCEAVKEVLGTPDPKLELPSDERCMASVHGKVHPYSRALREGLVGSIAHFALAGQELPGTDGQGVANILVRHLLGDKKLSQRESWLSLAPWLPDLAEASPDEFIQALEKLLTDKDAIAALFDEGGFFGSSPHTYVLWAFERLAWCKDLLTRVTLLLGELAAADPGGGLGNRPASTLTEIFLPWHPQTTADVFRRLDAIDVLYGQQPDVAWNMAVSLLPKVSGSSFPTAEPRWRDWKPDEEMKVPIDDYCRFVEQLLDRMILWAGFLGCRWKSLIEAYNELRLQHRDLARRLLAGLQEMDTEDLEEEDRLVMGNALRSVLSRHRVVPDADWAMSEDELQPLEEIYRKFQSRDLLNLHGWLFAPWPELPGGRDLSYKEEARCIQEQREKAIKAIYEAHGIQGLMNLAEKVGCPAQIGFGLANIDVEEAVMTDLVLGTLGIQPTRQGSHPHLQMGLGYVRGNFEKHGPSWIDNLMSLTESSWDANRFANLAQGMPTEGSTWDCLENWGEEAEKLYWSRAPIDYLSVLECDAERAFRRLLQAGRPYQAINLTARSIRKKRRKDKKQRMAIPRELIQEALEEAPKHDPKEEWYPPAMNSLPYEVEELLDLLEDEGIESSTLAKVEWAWMSSLAYSKRGLKALQELLSTDPKIFVDILRLVYCRENEEPQEPSEQEEARATQAFRLLERWRKVPGTVEERAATGVPEGDDTSAMLRIDQEKLFAWVVEARSLSEQCGRLSACDIRIGNVLAYAPEDPDGQRPCESVRNVIEQVASQELEDGLDIGIFNKRGAHFRAKGGDQERELAAKFQSYADELHSRWPRTAVVLVRVAEYYERAAKRFDEEDAIREFE